MAKPKLLWCGDIVAMTGFARVTENVLQRICDQYEVVVLSHNWWGDPTPLQSKYKMYPSSNRFQTAPFGEDRIREVVEKEKPDIVFTINDMWIINEQYKRIKDLHDQKLFKFVGYAPMDSYGWTGCLDETANDWDGVISYTEFGAHEFIRGGIKKPITIIPHGITKDQFYPMDDIFIVFNGNRNQFRKRIDITVEGFAKFAKDKPDTQLYLHMGLKDQGWEVMSLFARAMQREGIDPNGRIILTAQTQGPPNVEVDFLNTIYNAVDVGVNTCKGEGWGLVSHEHAACQVAQVVPDHTSCKEIFEGYGRLIRCDHVDVDTNYSREMPCPSSDHLAEVLTDLYQSKEKREAIAELCYLRATDERFNWDTIAHQFGEVFQEVLNPVVETSETQNETVPKKKKGRPAKRSVYAEK